MNLKELAASQLSPSWKQVLQNILQSSRFDQLGEFLLNEVNEGRWIHPEAKDLFRAFRMTDYDRVKVVLIGQDPYHGESQAMGLSFAVPNSLRKKPPSLKNLLKELRSDLDCEIPEEDSDLTGWATQGVLLLNTLLTVRRGEPLSHAESGWAEFTNGVIEALNHNREREKGMVFILLGGHAAKFRARIDPVRHRIIEAPHPSPLSAYRGFFGSRIYSRTNDALEELGHEPIDWSRISLK
jgi:uracil-DNA glycosylase